MIGIYKIINMLNGKVYIGQAIHIEQRWIEHKKPSSKSVISQAIRKYGIENFKFEVIEECAIDQLDKKEQFWIKHYNSIVPNGYNIAEDINTIHTVYRNTNKQVIVNIITDLKNKELTLSEIGNKYKLSMSTISRINNGKIHVQENEIYPIRCIHNTNNVYCINCGKQIGKYSKRCSICENKFRAINSQPLLSREELKQLIRLIPFTAIAKQFNVSDNTIRKWCDKYGLPKKKSEIKKISDEIWENI